jgi:hypothetical protein
MQTYTEWGQQTNDVGLARAYLGVYFPLAYQIFAAEATVASSLGVSVHSVIKAVNLVFDLGTFFVILWFLRRYRLDGRYVFYYWLHPFFLLIFWLGYVDSFLSFFAIFAVALLAGSSGVPQAFVAGIPVAAAAMFKPQALTLILATGMLIGGLVVVARRVTPQILSAFAFLVPTGLAFVGYSLYFKANGYPLSYLGRHSLESLRAFSPGLTENMLNIWTPVAYHYVEPGRHLYAVTGPEIYHTIGDVLVVVAFVASALFVALAERHRELGWQVFSVVTLGALLLPFLGTRAHENHLFLGLTLAIIALAAAPSWSFAGALNVLLAVQAVNLFGHYGFGLNRLTNWGFVQEIVSNYQTTAQLVAAWVTIVSFPFVLFFVARALAGRAGEQGEARATQAASVAG